MSDTNHSSSNHPSHDQTLVGSSYDSTALSEDAARRLNDILFPRDSYTHDKVYWADLPVSRRNRWISRQGNDEAARQVRVVWRIFKKDPLEPLRVYIKDYVITGLGLFVEGYTLFSVGNLAPLFKEVWPECWETYAVCNKTWVRSTDYLQIVGIICGQIFVGIEADWIGRRFGMVQDALIMTLGSVMFTAMWGTSLNGWVICFAWSQFVYGFGVGGEYPVVGTTSMEQIAGYGANERDRLHRGRRVALSFLMQGWGQVVNQAVLILLMLVFHNRLGDHVYNARSTQWTFRVSFGIIAAFTLYLAYLRYYHIKHTDDTMRAAKKRTNTSGYDIISLKYAVSHFCGRLIGTALGWFANDFAFYGNRVFSGVFIQIITGSSSVRVTWLYNFINVGVSLVGYYMGALLVDHKRYGRKWMQLNGFIMLFILLLISAAAFKPLTRPGAGVKAFEAIFFLVGFFNQFGPNTTTFLLAAECYPASIRATSHGVSAACGKLGALAPLILYYYISSRAKFWVATWFALAGAIITFIFVPDTSGLDLRELERYWIYVREGRASDYHGVAVHPRHLSLWERVVHKRHLAYDPEMDRNAKIDELRQAYETIQALSGMESGGADHLTPEQRDFLQNELASFFASEHKLQGHTDHTFSEHL